MTRDRNDRTPRATFRHVAVGGGVLIAVVGAIVSYRALERASAPDAAASPAPLAPAPAPPVPATAATAADTATAPGATSRGFLYGRISALDGTTYEGRLRWGGGEEAFWDDTFHGFKPENRWVAHVPPERLPRESRPLEIFGRTVARRERPFAAGRPLLARFGDIARIEAQGRSIRLTLKSGTAFDLDRFEASDFDDGLRVWDGRRGVVDLDSLQIRAIELLPTVALEAAPRRLHGVVRTAQGDFTGFVQWNREKGMGSDELAGESAEGAVVLRFDALCSIARRSRDSSVVTLCDGHEIVLSGSDEVGEGNRGISVVDRRYGRVLVSWDVFERVDFDTGGTADSGLAYDDFPPGRPLRGSVTTRAGSTLAGRLVYDLDESETTETLDAEDRGVQYTIDFGRIAAIAPREPDGRGALVVLHDGAELELAGTADVDPRHGGLLVYPDGEERPAYLRWDEIRRIEFARPPAIPPPTRD